MLFSGGLFLAAGATIAVALVEKTLSDSGYHWLGMTLRVLIPLAGMALGVYFIETNPIIGWLK